MAPLALSHYIGVEWTVTVAAGFSRSSCDSLVLKIGPYNESLLKSQPISGSDSSLLESKIKR